MDPDKLFCALILADGNKKSICGDLSIERRGKTRDKVIFLISTSSKIVAQLSVFKEFLSRQDCPIRDFMGTDKIRRFLAKTKQSRVLPISNLRGKMTQVCLKAKVLEISKPNLVFTRYGNYASVANALIEDETGTIKLCLWNEQIDRISAGDTIKIENAKTSTFKGQRQLRIGKKGLLSIIDGSACQMKSVSI